MPLGMRSQLKLEQVVSDAVKLNGVAEGAVTLTLCDAGPPDAAKVRVGELNDSGPTERLTYINAVDPLDDVSATCP